MMVIMCVVFSLTFRKLLILWIIIYFIALGESPVKVFLLILLIEINLLINGFNSAVADTICWVPQTSILGPLLFLVYINDLHCAIKYCKVHHFADTNLMNFQVSLKTINKQTNHDLKTYQIGLMSTKLLLMSVKLNLLCLIRLENN